LSFELSAADECRLEFRRLHEPHLWLSLIFARHKETVMKRSALILAALAAVLSACTVTVDEGNPPPRPRPPRPDICPRIYQPVCAERFGERQTFSNDCVAESRGFNILYDGECRRTPRPPRPDPLPGGGVVCPLINAPVCARQGGILRTFANSCVAEASDFTVIDNGPC
jgi:hypothetical protein